ncbi:hypothetical protein [Streptomyces lichenis]|uniref:Uncharacterized protein n=1 Tax=Streptomyces lichenis TaxID=2306967 RepID=A0ABT0IBW3_9ACTN|nr:hypothetical protein [Streptomyces lichenis]MCK8678803.1 hypothetical protein [Streptomyces lichenis]
MTIFGCTGCGAELTAPLTRVALPDSAHQKHGYHATAPVLMGPGTYAVDPAPSGPPWRRWSEISPEEAEAQGVHAPVCALSFGAQGAVALAPGDLRNTAVIPDRCGGHCCGLDGSDGPNLACLRCARPVATRIDDCPLWQVVWLEARAVRRIRDEPEAPAAGWDEVVAGEGSAPIDLSGGWNPRWEATVGAALARLLAASDGTPLAVPDGPLAPLFRRALDTLLPPGPGARTVALAGPGLPATAPSPDLALVPRHPGTGEVWRPPGGTIPVPLEAAVWVWLARAPERVLLPVTGGLPEGVERDDPLPLRPWYRFRPAGDVFFHTLARLPEVRRPWLRALYEERRERPWADPF